MVLYTFLLFLASFVIVLEAFGDYLVFIFDVFSEYFMIKKEVSGVFSVRTGTTTLLLK